MKIYYGASQPKTVVGKNQIRIAEFALKHPGWHSYNDEKNTKTAIIKLASNGIIEHNATTKQFKWA